MKYAYALALLASFAFVSDASAMGHPEEILFEVTDTVGLPGFQTVTLSIQTGPGESFRGFDATFTGPLGQVNPIGMDTPFNDLNGFFGATDVSQDSQFLFNSGDVLSIGVSEDASFLTGAISGLALLDPPLSNPAAFVQLVIADGATLGSDIQVELAFDIGLPQPLSFQGSLDTIIGEIPEPSTMMLAGLGLIGFVSRRRRS